MGFKSWLSVCNAVEQVQLIVSVKSETCFDSGQFVGGAKNLQDHCAVEIYTPKNLSIRLTLLVNFGKFWSNAANCSEIYAISKLKNRLSILSHHLHNTQTLENRKGVMLYYVYVTKYHKIITEIFSRILKRAVI